MKIKFFMAEQLTSSLRLLNPDIKSEVFSAIDDICASLFSAHYMRTIMSDHPAILIKITAYTDEEVTERLYSRITMEIRDRLWLFLCSLGDEQAEIVNDLRDQVKCSWGRWVGLTS